MIHVVQTKIASEEVRRECKSVRDDDDDDDDVECKRKNCGKVAVTHNAWRFRVFSQSIVGNYSDPRKKIVLSPDTFDISAFSDIQITKGFPFCT